jgi:hypothetical protein
VAETAGAPEAEREGKDYLRLQSVLKNFQPTIHGCSPVATFVIRIWGALRICDPLGHNTNFSFEDTPQFPGLGFSGCGDGIEDGVAFAK